MSEESPHRGQEDSTCSAPPAKRPHDASHHGDNLSSTLVDLNSSTDQQTIATLESPQHVNGSGNDVRPVETSRVHREGSNVEDEQAQHLLPGIVATPENVPLWAASPESSWSNPPLYSAETASLLWLGLLSSDAASLSVNQTTRIPDLLNQPSAPSAECASAVVQGWVQNDASGLEDVAESDEIDLEEDIVLEPDEVILFRHFVHVLSMWIDITDWENSFAVRVSSMALRNVGLMRAILALSARHLSVCPLFAHLSEHFPSAETLGVRYYHQTLQYLQRAMQHPPYLRSDQLLATVLLISTYEMLDTNGRDWERHLKGVFWIQRSQLIQGESGGLKQAIWWAWLRQDIWAAFKDRRKILSFYVLKRPCSELGFWELVNRSVFLLGQCVNYASEKEVQAGAIDVQARINRGEELWSSLEEWKTGFAQHDRRLPTVSADDFPFQPIWINPPAASLAVQVHHFARLLLSSMMPALGGLSELSKRRAAVQSCAATICGIAYCTRESAAMITSTECLYASRPHLNSQDEVEAVNSLLLSHQKQTGWPNHDIHAQVRADDTSRTKDE
ncbi:hypothetical protein M409DRAFT_24713 [Zasmidium cellare ATCC 36951]|uniref:Transcription factor domain-containing protein n=1 Tax=Zasmidium cellare ATCC 36951 TaxID=1080233 RepID=A0A6A6CF74_ZASCE|nr:uncharacterized protein M409DRAFT_24713 [Zasmidium cellare ATCC 36951]KAF2164808.1 hypothetical protein M409DRAFT_24713 [Zasmidium cellare ATCC 36951]